MVEWKPVVIDEVQMVEVEKLSMSSNLCYLSLLMWLREMVSFSVVVLCCFGYTCKNADCRFDPCLEVGFVITNPSLVSIRSSEAHDCGRGY